LVLEGLGKLLASPQLSPAACWVSKAVPKKVAAKVAFILVILMNGKGTERENRCCQRGVRQQTGLEFERKTFAVRMSEANNEGLRETLEDAEMKFLDSKGSLCHYVDMFHRKTF